MNNLAGKAFRQDRESLKMIAEAINVAAVQGDTSRARRILWSAMSMSVSEARASNTPPPSSWDDDTDPVFTACFTAAHCYIDLVFKHNMAEKVSPVYVYVITDDSESGVKIGVTNDLRKRLSTVQTGNPKKLRIAASFAMANRDIAEKAEEIAHNSLSKFAKRGEWFGCPPCVAQMEIESILSRDDIKDMYG